MGNACLCLYKRRDVFLPDPIDDSILQVVPTPKYLHYNDKAFKADQEEGVTGSKQNAKLSPIIPPNLLLLSPPGTSDTLSPVTVVPRTPTASLDGSESEGDSIATSISRAASLPIPTVVITPHQTNTPPPPVEEEPKKEEPKPSTSTQDPWFSDSRPGSRPGTPSLSRRSSGTSSKSGISLTKKLMLLEAASLIYGSTKNQKIRTSNSKARHKVPGSRLKSKTRRRK